MRCAVFVALIFAMLAGGSSSAFAVPIVPFTEITNSPAFPSETQTKGLLQTTYAPSGPSFVKVGEDYTNGVITATRVMDRSPILLADGFDPIANAVATIGGNLNGNDQLWQANFKSATAKAIFGNFGQAFGYYDGSSGGTFHSLFNATGTGFGITGSATFVDNSLTQTILRWARGGDNGIFSSQESDNADGTDHMITFRIEGLNNGLATWLLMFEDKKPGQDFYDRDYNDLVVQIQASPVPEPASVGLLLLGGACLGLRRRRA